MHSWHTGSREISVKRAQQMWHSEGKTVLNRPLAAVFKGAKSAENPVGSETRRRARSPVLLKTDLPGHIESGWLNKVYHCTLSFGAEAC